MKILYCLGKMNVLKVLLARDVGMIYMCPSCIICLLVINLNWNMEYRTDEYQHGEYIG
jgi:hypothetical protein